MARFFIDRPIFAWVVSLGILLSGFIALRALPIEQYPEVAPPSLAINVVYPGADAETLEQNVTQVIEQQLNGVEGFLYMSSSSLSNGTASITLTFEAGTDIDIAQTEVQNKVRPYCPGCGFMVFLDPKMVAVVLVSLHDKLVLVRRGVGPQVGWTVNAGGEGLLKDPGWPSG